MTDRPTVLIVQPHLGQLAGFLVGTYDVLLAWENPSREALDRVGAIIVTGEFALDKALIETLPALKLVACFSSGHDRIDIDWCHIRGLAVTHAPGVNHEDVADHALGLIIAARRQIVAGDRLIRHDGWTVDTRMIVPGLKGQRLGIVGLGAIGQAIANRAAVFGMTVQWWGPRDKPANWPRADTLIDLTTASDIMVVACKADDSNIGLISADVIAALGPQGLLVNVARGQLVDEDALIAALKSGVLGQAALDVFDHEPTTASRWADVPNVVLTPHTGGATTGAVQAMLMLLLQNLEAAFADRPLITEVKT